jgi:cell fate regulator YaaT (PSP1 superfamily)
MKTNGCSKKIDKKLDTFDWLCDIPDVQEITDYVEVIFKNTRKGYYRNTNNLKLEKGDIVAVESSPGHDIGTISLTGPLVLLQMKKNSINPAKTEIKRIYRKARSSDLEKYEEAKAREPETMLKARKIAEELKLNMKIGDVEYQGDGNKAIFYYIADERVDFRQLIKVLADSFKVRIEMKQIGARQEAGRIGGIGPCGRPLCCSQWMSTFVSVATSAARYQEISLNPQKLAGQCAKLKCCMNFELDGYVEAQKDIPPKDIPLETKDATYYHFKTDVFKKEMQYSSSPNMAANIVTIPAERVKEIIALNKQGIKEDSLGTLSKGEGATKENDYENVIGQDSLTRFDNKKRKNKSKNRRTNNRPIKADEQRNSDSPNSAVSGERKKIERNSGNEEKQSNQNKNRQEASPKGNPANRRKKPSRPVKPQNNEKKAE